jgi:hypothetical protein
MRRTLQHQKLMAQRQDLSVQGSAGAQRAAKREKHKAENCRHGGRDRLQGRTGKVNRLNQNGVFTRDSVFNPYFVFVQVFATQEAKPL